MMDDKLAKYSAGLRRYVPLGAVEPLISFLVTQNQVKLRVTNARRTKLGDYKCPQTNHYYHEISINGNLNPYYFLYVLLHEMAHLNAWKRYKRTIQPHGEEWQAEYAQLLNESLTWPLAFPNDVALMVASYASRIPLNHRLAKQIETQLTHYDPGYGTETWVTLDDLPLGTRFRLQARPQQLFQSEEKLRTRYKCRDLSTGSLYVVNGCARILSHS